MKIYIGCGLTHVPRELFKSYCSFVHRLAARLQTDHQVKYALRDSDPQLAEKPYADRARLCYVWDRRMVEEADTMIAEVSFPATGLGVELQIAESKGIPLILCYSDLGN